MLRNQLGNLQKMASQPVRGPRVWEWTPESIDYHLQTRFSQLEVATVMELWNEGFETVEDIYSIMLIGKKSPKSRLMVSYYEKLTRIFWVSENHLFHAYAWYRYYTLSCERRDMKRDEKTLLATCVLLSALCIPSIKETDSSAAILDDDEVASEKNQRMALLLDFNVNPTRQSLLNEIVSKGLLNEVSPELAGLYHHIEATFHPLKMVKGLSSILNTIKSTPLLAQYSIPLQKIAVMRTMQQMSRVYNTVKIEFVQSLFSGVELSFSEIEKLIVDGVSKKQLHLRIDHSGGCMRFGTSSAATAAIDTQLAQLGAALNKISRSVNVSQVTPVLLILSLP